MDVAVSKDKILVVTHEPFMSRTICLDPKGKEIPESDDKKHNLYQMTFDSIKQFDCGLKYHPKFKNQQKLKAYKPSLDEVIKATKTLNPKIKFNIEIKAKKKYDSKFTPKPDEFVALVLEVVNSNDAFNETNLQSFDLRVLEEIKRQSPNMKVAILINDGENIVKKLTKLSYKPEIIGPYFKLLTQENVAKYQAEHYKITPWTVNSKKNLKKMINFKVDGIITDYPDRLIELLK